MNDSCVSVVGLIWKTPTPRVTSNYLHVHVPAWQQGACKRSIIVPY